MKIKKKYEAGAATNYVTRTKAMRKLQLSLRDFRRLCILKGIYPREPTHKKTVNKGSTENRVWYYVKDIQFLTQEPIINKFREYKVFLKKVSHAKAKKDPERVKRLFETKPAVTLDRIVKERYPTFGTALRDLDDALCLCFAMATLPHTKVLPSALLNDCRRLTAEFAHYVIESHSLTKSFISIKGIYFQAEIQGERITWVVPHDRGVGHVSEVDFTLLSTFAEFYVAFLGFVNYRLYTQLGLFYPPKIETGRVTKENVGEEDEVVYSLARPLARRPDAAERDEESDLLAVDDVDGEFAQRIKNAKALTNLFKNCIFWLNREVPKESLTLLIRGAGGTVTWEGAPPDAQGKTIAEDDPRITYQVVDRPVTKFVLSRTYVQPQWIWDCFNARRHMPTAPYAPGAALPPHFSPFVDERAGDYVPIERLDELRSQGKDVTALVSAATAGDEPPKKKKKSEKVDKKKEETEANKKAMAVKLGYAVKKNPQKVINEKDGELKLRELMIAKKHRRVYDKIKHGKRRQKTEAGRLVEKRKKIEAQKTARASS